MKLTLDKSRPFGTIEPPWHGAFYSQAVAGRERFFDFQGQRVMVPGDRGDDDLAPKQAASASGQPAPVASDPSVPPPKNKGGRPRKQAPEQPAAVPPAPPPPDMGAEINLAEWAAGKLRVPFSKVRDAIEQRFNSLAVDERRAVEILVEASVIEEDEVHVLD